MKESRKRVIIVKKETVIEHTRWLCSVLNGTGSPATMHSIHIGNKRHTAVQVIRNGKLYKFSDPDLNVINKQLVVMVNTALHFQPLTP
jgi:hypothetical protein